MGPGVRALFVARSPDGPVGFCRAYRDPNAPTHWWLSEVVVDPDHRRRGIGRALGLAGIDYARARGAKIIRSETHTDNTVSIRFHEGIGFSNDGRFVASDGDRKVAFSMRLC